ncbi:MAG: hypothetical protein ACE5HP_08570 [Gemmatimonadota bacterium]
MVAWLIPIGLFWLLASLYLGGMNVQISGGSGVRQTLGLIETFVLFLLLWWASGRLLGGTGPFLGEILLPTAISVVAIPLLARVGFRMWGVRISRGAR